MIALGGTTSNTSAVTRISTCTCAGHRVVVITSVVTAWEPWPDLVAIAGAGLALRRFLASITPPGDGARPAPAAAAPLDRVATWVRRIARARR